MTFNSRSAWTLVAIVLCWTTVLRGAEEDTKHLKIFSGEPRLLIAHGYSTSAHWWAFLQRKIDRHMGGPDKRTVEVQLCNKGGTPIAKWMDVKTGKPFPAWRQMLTPMIHAEQGKRPVVVLCQQSLQWAFTDRRAGIRNSGDAVRIGRGADIIGQYGKQILDDGAAAVFVAMHIYKVSMEPEIGNERLALAHLLKRNPKRIFAGPDVWTPTSKQHPLAFDRDKVHPNYIGAEIMSHYWFATLLKHDGLEVPEWSRQEMDEAITGKPLGLTRGRDTFTRLLKEWRITRRSARPNQNRPQSSGGARRVSRRILERYDKDGDGKLNEKERAAFEEARKKRRDKQSTTKPRS